MANIRLASLLLVLAFLSFPPALHGILPLNLFDNEDIIGAVIRTAKGKGDLNTNLVYVHFEKKIKSEIKDTINKLIHPKSPPPAVSPTMSPPSISSKASPPIKSSQLKASPPNMSSQASPPNMPPQASPPSDNTETEPIGFYVTFSVGNSSTAWIDGQMSISRVITLLNNYQPSVSPSYQCCTENLTCSKTNCDGDYYLGADTINFNVGNITEVPYLYNSGDTTKSTTGLLSFSRSPYSLISIAQAEVFSYFFSDFKGGNSSVTIGPTDYTGPLQSTNIVTNPNYTHLYYVSLTRISVGTTNFVVDPKTNSSIVILDTVIVPTLLETSVYANVTTELKKLGNSYPDQDSGLEVCYKSDRMAWPNLTFFFPSDPPSAGAQMVLTENSYVRQVDSGAYCAVLYESIGGSVIGILAQLNREMIFNISNSGPRLQFSQYPASEAAFLTKATMNRILLWSLSVLLYLHTLG